MSESEISVGGALTIIVVLVAIVVLLVGFSTMAGANFSDPLNGVKQWIVGIIEVGVATSIILAAMGAIGAIVTVLSFILAVIRRD
jgi:hypothetical protein